MSTIECNTWFYFIFISSFTCRVVARIKRQETRVGLLSTCCSSAYESDSRPFRSSLQALWRFFCTRNWSHIATHIVVIIGAVLFKKAQGSVVSNHIGMKFGTVVFQVNAHRFFDVTSYTFRMAATTSFDAEKCCLWWVHNAYAASAHCPLHSPAVPSNFVYSSWSTVCLWLLGVNNRSTCI